MKALRFLIVALVLAACDSKTLEAEGTSSETQTELQALADSIAMIHAPGQPNLPPVAGRALRASESEIIGEVNTLYWYGFDARTNSMGAYISSNRSRVVGLDSVEFLDSVRWIDGAMDLLRVRRTLRLPSGVGVLQEETAAGTTRTGFRFLRTLLASEDRARLALDPRRFPTGDNEATLYALGNGWELAIPETWTTYPDSFPLFRNGKPVGWMIQSPGTPLQRPVNDLSGYVVHDREGRKHLARSLPVRTGWIADSLGVFWGDSHLDPQAGDLRLDVRWRFLPGTVASVHTLDSTGLRIWDPLDSTLQVASVVFDRDVGAGQVRFPGLAPGGVMASRRLNYAWSLRGGQAQVILEMAGIVLPAFPR